MQNQQQESDDVAAAIARAQAQKASIAPQPSFTPAKQAPVTPAKQAPFTPAK